ncbi:unnamed protein product [Ectocarpus sp. 4 AP-2014]
MSYVERLREQLMGSLGFEVENQSCLSDNRGSAGERDRKARRRRSGAGAISAVQQVGVPYPYALRPRQIQQQRQQQQQQQGRRAADDSSCMVGGGCLRPQRADLPRVPHSRRRPVSASSVRYLANKSNMNDGYSGVNKDMDVLLKICRDQGRANSLNPADFDSSISAIANLPVKQFMTAAKDGWGPYFRNLHSKMRKETTPRSTTTAKRMNRPPPERRRRSSHQQHPPLPLPRRASSSGATKDEKKNNRRYSKVTNNLHHMVRSADVASSDSNKRRRRRQSEDDNSDGLAASRARAAKRQAEEMVIRRMGVRLQALWQELKIPDPDRAYVTAAYLDAGGGGGGFSGQRAGGGGGMEKPPVGGGGGGGGGGNSGPTSENVNRELTRQIRLLLEHRATTVKVLRSVNARESRLCEVEQALQAFQWHRGLDTDALGVVVSLAGLRDASLDVVRAVEEWRTNLWQPRAFCWRGVNYLEKMSQDTIFLRSPVGKSLLASVGLEAEDMTFVLFPSGNGGGAPSAIPRDSSTCGSELSDGEIGTGGDVLRPPPAIVRLTPKAELVSAYRARFFEQSTVDGAGGRPGGESGDVGGEIGRLKTTAAAATAAMEAVVVQEAALQRRVEAERVRLATKGCFVPLLRWLPGDSRNPAPKGKRRRSSSSPPPVPPAAGKTNPPPGAESEIYAAKHAGDSFAHDDVRSGATAVPDVSDSAAIPPDLLTGGELPLQLQQQHQQQPATVTNTSTSAGASLFRGSVPDSAQQKKLTVSGEGDGHEEEDREDEDGDEDEDREHDEKGQASLLHTERVRSQKLPARVEEGGHGQTESESEGPQAGQGSTAEVEGRSAFHENGVGEQTKMTNPLSPSFRLESSLHPPGAEEESRSEIDKARRSACTVGAEARAGENGCLKLVATSVCGVGSAGTPVGGVSSGDGGDRDTDKPSIIPGELRQEGIVDEERSVAPSVCYDDDFEEDAEGYSLSDSEGSGEGGSANFGESLNGSISSDDAKDARRDQGVAHTTEEAGAAISCGERRQNPLVGDSNVLEEHQRQQQLVEERETVAATAALRIQRSVRAWLRRRSRPRNTKPDEKEGAKESAEEGKQEWLDAWRARRHSQVRQAQRPEEIQAGAAIRIQTTVRGDLASRQVEELRRELHARKMAATLKIQAFVRRRRARRNTAAVNRHEISENADLRQQQEAETDPELAGVGVCRGTAREGEEEILAVSSEFDLAEAATRSDRSARTIQKAVRRRLSSGNATSKADGLPAMEAQGQPNTLEGEAQGQPGVGKRGDGPGAVLVNRCGPGDGSSIPSQQAPVVAAESSSSAGDELDSPSSSAVVDEIPSSTPASGADGLDARLSDADDENNQPDVAESAFVEAGLPSTSLPSENPAESETADDAAGGDLSQTLHSRDGGILQPEGTSSRSPLPSPTTPRPEAAERGQQEKDHQRRQAEGNGEAAISLHLSSATAYPPSLGPTVNVLVGSLPVDTDTSADVMMTTVVGTHAGGGSESIGFSAVGLSPVPERQALVAVAASASEYGSEDLDFDALSSSPGGSSRGGGSRGEEENAGVAARVATKSSVVTTREKVEEPTESQGIERAAASVATPVTGAAAEKNPAGDIEPFSLAAAEAATTKEVERGGTQCTEDGSDNSSVVSLSVSSGS